MVLMNVCPNRWTNIFGDICMEDEFPPLYKGIKEGFSFLVREIRSRGKSTATNTSSTDEPSVGIWLSLETASSLGILPFWNILWKGEAIRKLLKGLFSSGWFGFCALIRQQCVGLVELSHYISQGTLQSVAAADRRGEASSAFLNVQWQGVQANIVLFGFSSGERETDTLSTGKGW